jgi:hypothetical protein
MHILARVVGMSSSHEPEDAIIEQISVLLAQAEQRADKRHRDVCDRIARMRDELQKQIDARFDVRDREVDDLARLFQQMPAMPTSALLERVAYVEHVARVNWRLMVISVGLAIVSLIVLTLHAVQMGALSGLAGR